MCCMSEKQPQTYPVMTCASGCAFHSTVADPQCLKCGGKMGPVRRVSREELLALIRNDSAYQAGKRAHCAASGVALP